MKITNKVLHVVNEKGYQFARKLSLSICLFIGSILSSVANAAGKDGDIMKQLVEGSIGKTLSKDGLLWTVLIAITFAVATFYAAIKNDPKAFIPAFIVMAIITTITGVVLGF